MKYYKVKPEYDNHELCLIRKGRYVNNGDILIGNELYTACECEKLQKTHVFCCDPMRCVEVVEVPKSKVYWFFGARFA